MTKSNEDLAREAKQEAKKIREEKYIELVQNIELHRPRVLFTSGSPGAGKSEVVKSLLEGRTDLLVLDPDMYREYFDNYTGDNAPVFTPAATDLLGYFIDRAMRDRYNLVIDTNFIDVGVAKRNIQNALKNNYNVSILYVYMDPIIAWEFVKTRTRKVDPETFKRNLKKCRTTVMQVMSEPEFVGKISLTGFITQPSNGCSAYQIGEMIRAGKTNLPLELLTGRFPSMSELESDYPIPYSPVELDQIAVY